MHGIKKKRIKYSKKVTEESQEEHRKETKKMVRQLERARKDGYRVVYIDETMFTRQSIPKKEYCLPHENVTVDKHKVNEKTLAVLAGVSKEKGMETYMIFENSVNVPKFREYLQKLRNDNGDDRICIFLDNLTAHTSNKSKDEMRNLGFRFIFNIAYAPDYNPIEFVFSKIK